MKKLLAKPAIITARRIVGTLIPLGFAVYNAVIGFKDEAVFNVCIFGYYVLLFLIKCILTITDMRLDEGDKRRKGIYAFSFFMLLFINLILIGPCVLLIQNKRAVHTNLITSIAMAAYAFYNIVNSVLKLRKSKKDDNILTKQLNLVCFVNAVVSIIVLQNTLINVNGELEGDMVILSIVSSFTFIALLLFMTVYSFVRNVKRNRQSSARNEDN